MFDLMGVFDIFYFFGVWGRGNRRWRQSRWRGVGFVLKIEGGGGDQRRRGGGTGARMSPGRGGELNIFFRAAERLSARAPSVILLFKRCRHFQSLQRYLVTLLCVDSAVYATKCVRGDMFCKESFWNYFRDNCVSGGAHEGVTRAAW